MFSTKECTVINWSKNGDVQGVTLRTLGKAVLVLSAVERKHSSGEMLAERLQDVYDEIAPHRDTHVILSGHIKRGAYLDIKLPNLSEAELERMLEFELARRVPFPIEDLVWLHEVVADTIDSTGRVTVRVFIAPESDWNEIISHLRVSGVKADMFIPTFMSELGNRTCYLPSINEDFLFAAPGTGGLRSFIVSSEFKCSVGSAIDRIEPGEFETVIEQGAFAPALMCGVHILEHPVKIHNPLMTFPPDILPQRLRAVRFALLALLVVTFTLIGAFSIQVYRGNSARMWALEDELSFVQRRIKKLQQDKMRANAVINKIESVSQPYHGDHNLIGHLAELTQALPNEMRLTNLSQREKEFDLAIVTESYSEAALENLEKNPEFEVMSVRKRTLRGVTAVDVTLNIKEETQ